MSGQVHWICIISRQRWQQKGPLIYFRANTGEFSVYRDGAGKTSPTLGCQVHEGGPWVFRVVSLASLVKFSFPKSVLLSHLVPKSLAG